MFSSSLRILASLFLVVAAHPARGQAPDYGEVERRLARLEARVADLEEDAVGRSLQDLEEAIADDEVVPLAPSGRRFFEFRSADGAFELRIGGRLQMDLGFFGQDERYERERGRIEDGVAFRRARIDLRGRLHRHVRYAVGYEFRGGTVAFLPAYLELQGLPRRMRVRVGYTRAPFGLQAATSSLHLPHLERGAINRLSPGLRAGLFLSGTELEERFRWELSIYRAVDLRGTSAPRDDDAFGVALRLGGEPWREEGRLLHLGLGLAHEEYGRSGVRFRERPGVRLLPFAIDTLDLDAASGTAFGAEFALVVAPFEFSAEAVALRLEGLRTAAGAAAPAWLRAYQARASWFLTGEVRDWNARRGGFAGLTPRRPWPAGPGALELGLRFEHLDLDDGVVRGGEQTIHTLQLAWHLDGRSRVTLAWLRPRLASGARADLVVIRFQIDF